jgi:cytochrome b561
MLLRNSRDRYGLVAQTLHWIVAVLFAVSYCSVYYRHWFTEKQTPENWLALQLHLAAGITVGVFVALRVAWRLTNAQPDEPPGSRLEHFAARSAHFLLYAFMIVMPITGYLGTGVATDSLWGVGDVPSFRNTALFHTVFVNGLGLTWEQFEAPIDFIHKNSGAYLVWVLVLVHVAAALYHHWVRRDSVLRRMLPRVHRRPLSRA